MYNAAKIGKQPRKPVQGKVPVETLRELPADARQQNPAGNSTLLAVWPVSREGHDH
jgi:hypothetical protein